MLGEKQDVLWALTQRGKREGHNREPMVEVPSETPGLHCSSQVFVGRADDLDVDGLGARAAETTHGLFLDYFQKLGLDGLGQQRHLVEKDRSVIRGMKEPRLRLPGVGKRTALVAEQLGFDQSVRNRGAVHIDERAVGPGAAAVDQPGEHALARARFALQQDRREPMRALLSGEQLPGLLADCCDCATYPKQLVRRDHSALSYIRAPPPATGGFSPPFARSMTLSYCFRDCEVLARRLQCEASGRTAAI